MWAPFKTEPNRVKSKLIGDNTYTENISIDVFTIFRVHKNDMAAGILIWYWKITVSYADDFYYPTYRFYN